VRMAARPESSPAGAAQLLAGKALDLDAFIPSTEPPERLWRTVPKTPFEMNRRFLAMARFNADPEPAIRAHAKRIARREGIDLNSPLRHDATHRDTPPASPVEDSNAGALLPPSPTGGGGGARLRATEGAATARAVLPSTLGKQRTPSLARLARLAREIAAVCLIPLSIPSHIR